MRAINKQLKLHLPIDKAFWHFVENINEWWPREYTWSKDKLQQIYIEPEENGKCTEIGPYNFRCDWGRVIDFLPNQLIAFTWQISPKREPVPNPEMASLVTLHFLEDEDGTEIHFRHSHFENHGEEGENYMNMMNGEYGWDYILKRFKTYCEQPLMLV